MSKICKILRKINIKKANNPIKNEVWNWAISSSKKKGKWPGKNLKTDQHP